MTQTSTGHYRIRRGGPKSWYVQRITDNELVSQFRTKQAATAACARRNRPAEMKQVRKLWAV